MKVNILQIKRAKCAALFVLLLVVAEAKNAIAQTGNIAFADADVKALCIANWDTNEDGELSYAEAAVVTNLGAVFFSNSTITSFDELQYFTGLTSIGETVFYRCIGLTWLTIPNSVTSIGYSAFAYCSSLTSVTIPESVTSIGNNAFYRVKNIYYTGSAPGSPWGAYSINGYIDGDFIYADAGNTQLEAYIGDGGDVTIPNSVISIEDEAFYGCTDLTSVTIPSSVISIRDYAFNGCTGLTTVTFGNSVTSIGEGAFKYCSGLTLVTIPCSLISIGDYAFQDCTGLTTVTFGSSVTFIGKFAFQDSGLTSVIIPDSVTSIGEGAFHNCVGLTSVTIPDSVTSIGEGAFHNCSSLTSVTIPNSVISIGDYAYYGCTDLTTVSIGNSVTSIGNSSFAYCSSLTSVIVPDSVISIGNDAFYRVKNICYNGSAPGSPWGAFSINGYIDGDFIYADVGNTQLEAYIGDGGDVTIPNSVISIEDEAFYGCIGLTSVIIGHSVTSIGESTFEGCSNLISVTIPYSVTSIGDYAFYGCTSLTSVYYTGDAGQWCGISFENLTSNPLYYCHNLYIDNILVTDLVIPNSVTSIGDYAFYGCNGLTSLTIGNSETSIGDYAFYGCSGLTSLTIGNSVTSIGDYAFYGCTGLTSLNIGNSVTSIGESTFEGCSNLISVTISYSVTSIGEYAFYGCDGLISVYYTGDIRQWCGISFEDLTSNPLYYCHSLYIDNVLVTDLVIPNSVTSIGDYAFYGCSGLTSLTIPNSVTSIGDYAFYGCSGLTSLTIGDSVTSIGNSAFRNCSGLTSVTVPNSVTSIGVSAFIGCSSLVLVNINSDAVVSANYANNNAFNLKSMFGDQVVSYILGPSVTSIGNAAFRGCSGLTSVTIGNSVTSIGDWAFYGCNGLTSASIPSSVMTIGNYAFWECRGLTSVTIPDSVTSVGYYAFYCCTGMTSVILGNSLTTIGHHAFQFCSGLTSLTIPNSVTTIGGGAFQYCSGLSSVDIPHSMTMIEQNVFQGCTGLNSVTIPNSVTSIGSSAFSNCIGLTAVIIPNSVTSIGNYAFSGCSSLTAVTIPNSVTTIGAWAFVSCSSMASLTIPNSVTTIGWQTFGGCISLTSVTIPNSVTSIEGNAFQDCSGLTSLSCMASIPPALGMNVFNGVDKSIPVTVPCNTENAYQAASGWSEFTNFIAMNNAIQVEFAITACDEYTWNGMTYYSSGDYQQTYVSSQGCDSIVTMHLTINQTVYVYSYAEACSNFTWNGVIYETTGDYTQQFTTAQGCDSIVTLHLTVNYDEEEEYYVTARDEYVWHDMILTQSGTYYYETTTYAGCLRTEILHLTIEDNHWIPVGDGQYPFTMTLYGVVSIDGVEQTNNQLELGVFCGDECRGTAKLSEFFLTHRYLAEANIYGENGEQMTFRLYDHASHQELNLTPPEAITFTIDGYGNPVNPYVLNFTSTVNITATAFPEGAGMVTGTGEYTMGSTCTLTATANAGFQFLNWTLDGTVVSTSPNTTFTVTDAANYVAHFQYVQSRTLVSGWNWWSTYIEQQGTNGLEMLENSLGTSGVRIQGKNKSVDYFEYQGTGYWYGSLNAIANEQMYMIRTNETCDAIIVGDAALPMNHPITINSGWNWIGYPSIQSMTVEAAMAGFSPETNDVIKGRNSVSMFLSYGDYQGWYGQLNTLEPGQGYMYRSYSNATKTLTFQTGRGGETVANITPEGNVFVPNMANYANNMIVTAVIDMDGAELRSEDYELAAFVGNECRGSVKLMYVEPIDRYVALLMAYGEGEEGLHFVLTDGKSASWSKDNVMYIANGMVGMMTDPIVLHFGRMGTEDNIEMPIHVYPNPSNGIFNVEGEGILKIEVVNIYGQVVLSKDDKNTKLQVNLNEMATGAYLLRVVTDGRIVTHKLIKSN